MRKLTVDLEKLYRLTYAAIREADLGARVEFYDVSDVFASLGADEAIFYDYCHVNSRGAAGRALQTTDSG